MTEPVAVALQTIFDNMPHADEKVVVIGGGVIGNLIIQAIRALVPGCSISLIEPSSFAADLAKKAGADEVIPSKDVFDIPSDNGMIISLFSSSFHTNC
jgi:(R,R)-butanediol dehydrogenase/meso-butanediol dehydrogenase/diacetyl reductase